MSSLFPEGLRFGIHAGQQYTDFPSYLELWQTAEELGLDWASVFDHFMPIQADPSGPCFEGLTLLSAMASIPRIVTGAIAGIVAPAVGWPNFFIITCITAVPGLIVLLILKRPLNALAEREAAGG